MTNEYRKFYLNQALTRRELKKLDLIDRIRYLTKRVPNSEYDASMIHEILLTKGLISSFITKENIEQELLSYYGIRS